REGYDGSQGFDGSQEWAGGCGCDRWGRRDGRDDQGEQGSYRQPSNHPHLLLRSVAAVARATGRSLADSVAGRRRVDKGSSGGAAPRAARPFAGPTETDRAPFIPSRKKGCQPRKSKREAAMTQGHTSIGKPRLTAHFMSKEQFRFLIDLGA